jgi:hypothetical protein
LVDYQRVQNESRGTNYVWMEKLVSYLPGNRDLSMLYPITSHYRLIAFIGTKFEEMYERPALTIKLTHEIRPRLKDKCRYKFTLTTGYEGDGVYRSFDESIFCSFEKSLEVFDEIFAKLETATATSLMEHKKKI